MRRVIIIILLFIALIIPKALAQNRVLSLDGDGDYVEIAQSKNLNAISSQVTVEAWIKVTEFPNSWMPIICKGELGQDNISYALWLSFRRQLELLSAPDGLDRISLISQSGLIAPNTWYHVAGIIDAQNEVMKILLNGIEVASGSFGTDILVSSLPLRIGWTHEEGKQLSPFAGQIDEVRIWNIARTQEEIRATIHTSLSGKEPGLVGYWRFDDIEDIARDSSDSHSDGKLIGDTNLVEAQLPTPDEVIVPSVLWGMITDEIGKPIPNAAVRVESVHEVTVLRQNGEDLVQTQAGASGSYQIAILSPLRGWCDLSATHDVLGKWQLNLRLRSGERRELNLTLKPAISLSGQVLMLDDKTPHVAVPVQVVQSGKVISTQLSDENGEYRFINLKPGQYQLRCQRQDGYVYYRSSTNENGLTGIGEAVGDILLIEADKTLSGLDFRFAPFKKGMWKTYASLDGLASNVVNAIYCAPDGVMWFGTRSGVSRYDGNQFVNFTTKSGLVHNYVLTIYGEPDGTLWFGTRGGVSRYNGKEFNNFTTQTGLADNVVKAINRSSDGMMWFGTEGGVSRYDGRQFVNFTRKDGLAHNQITSIYCAPDGVMWFGTLRPGISRYDGKKFVNFTVKDGLCNFVRVIHGAPDGTMWFGTGGSGTKPGVYRYDGKTFVNLTSRDGLASDRVRAIHGAPDGTMWFGTEGGVSCYDGKIFLNFTPKDGLAHNSVWSISRAHDGAMWFGTWGGGVSRYDEKAFLNLTTEDGLAHNHISAISPGLNGVIWFGTSGGVSRYDGKQFTNFTTEDGLAHNQITSIYCAPDGVMWFGAFGAQPVSRYDEKGFVNFGHETLLSIYPLAIHGDLDGTIWFGVYEGGVAHYDGKKFTNFTTKDGLAHNDVNAIHQDPDGTMWFGTLGGGVSRYDRKKFINFTTKDGLASNIVNTIYRDSDGLLWFGTAVGVSQYSGENFNNFTVEDGLPGNEVHAIYCDDDGTMWFGTSAGVSRYDGQTWTSLDRRDGLAGNTVRSIHQDSDGSLWFGTDGGVTRYNRSTTKPFVRIVSVKTDREYADFEALPSITTGTRVTIKYNAIDFKTVPGKRLYRYRLNDSEWRRATKETSFDDSFDKSGAYTFEVQAIDRDLNYSQPASLTLKVVPPWYLNGWIALPSVGGILALLIWSIALSARVIHQRRQIAEQERQSREALEAKNEQISTLNEQLQDENLRMAAELEITERIQQMILPSAEELQSIADLDIAGYMQPADDVGGDYYDVLQREGTVAISIGDVTGHGLESGLVMLMTQTAVRALLKSGETDPVHFLDTLNRTIYDNVQRMDSDKNLTLCLLDYQSGELKLSGQHEEMIVVRRDGQVELVDTIDLGFPIGLDDDIADFIDQTTVRLKSGDGVVLYTDGITEAENANGEQYGLERLCEIVRRHWPQSAEAIKEAAIADVRQHIGEQEVYDDITLVVLKQK